MRKSTPRLSKSRFLAGLQCAKRLYLELYARDLAAPPDSATQARLDAGTEIGVLARRRFPGGRLVEADYLHFTDADAQTRTFLADPTVPALFEPAFRHDDVVVRADVLVRQAGDTFDLIEVKSTARAKEQHVPDLAVQRYVIEGAGLTVARTYLMHLDRSYVYGGGAYDLEQLFHCADLTEQVRAQPDIAATLQAMRVPLWDDDPPAVATGPHCTSPYRCPFYGHCHEAAPEHPIEELPGLRPAFVQALAESGITDIRAIPPGFAGLNPLQERVCEAVRTKRRYHDPAIAEELAEARFPLHFLDFETFMPTLPIFVGTRPFETIPFQWSDHVLSADGQLSHREFLYDGTDDPRTAFAESLLEATADAGSVVVYSGYEAARLRDLEAARPVLARPLAQLRGRLLDLHPVIKKHVYDPAFHGSFSIKTVLPALVPDLGYGDLDIVGGELASLAYEELRKPDTAADRRAQLRANLLAYCRRDTEAMVALFRTLR